jgi:hypothetical protein
MMEYLNEIVPIQENNQIQLAVETKIKEKSNITYFSEVNISKDEAKLLQKDPNFILVGLHSK